MIKIECNKNNIDVVEHLVKNKIPICCHLGLTPQLIYKKIALENMENHQKNFLLLLRLHRQFKKFIK